jgi:hypothetical protein
MKQISILVISAAAMLGFKAYSQQLNQPVVFFDLGNVIVDTKNWKDVHYFDSSLQFLSELKDAGISTNLIANIPDSFGATCEAKFERLKAFMTEVWRPGAAPFDWDQFDSVYVPPSNQLGKPHPYLFVGAASHICPQPMLFIGEDLTQVNSAAELGIGSFSVGTETQPLFPSIERVNLLSRSMRPDCDFNEIWTQINVAQGFHGCVMRSSQTVPWQDSVIE